MENIIDFILGIARRLKELSDLDYELRTEHELDFSGIVTPYAEIIEDLLSHIFYNGKVEFDNINRISDCLWDYVSSIEKEAERAYKELEKALKEEMV